MIIVILIAANADLAVAMAMARAAFDGKGADIRVLQVKSLVYWARFFVIITAFSKPQLEAIGYGFPHSGRIRQTRDGSRVGELVGELTSILGGLQIHSAFRVQGSGFKVWIRHCLLWGPRSADSVSQVRVMTAMMMSACVLVTSACVMMTFQKAITG